MRESGANVIETMSEIRVVLDELAAGPVAAQGLVLEQVYDETIYIESAIDLVVQNIWMGGLLAAGVLMLFLRSPLGHAGRVSLAIPVSIVATFVAMAATGRTLNVISLAGIAFAIGMIVDAAIVVLENIFRLREKGLSRREAAYLGASQVWGAILVSALTTVMVFIPILVMELEAGQLFRDIAVAISVSVMLSLVVAVTVMPALASPPAGPRRRGAEGHAPAGDRRSRRALLSGRDGIHPARDRQSARSASRFVAAIAGIAGAAAWAFLAQARVPARGQPQPRLRADDPAARATTSTPPRPSRDADRGSGAADVGGAPGDRDRRRAAGARGVLLRCDVGQQLRRREPRSTASGRPR